MSHSKREPAGFWEPVTATVDWCEDNYKHTRYVAELWNSLTSIVFVLAGTIGVSKHAQLPLCVRAAFCGMLLVGIGSVLFHGTLKHSMQLLDELPMIYTEVFVISCFCQSYITKAFLFLLSVMFTMVYIGGRNPKTFQLLYGGLQIVCLAIFAGGLRKLNDPNLKKVFVGSMISTLFAFTLWSLDNKLCHSHLRPWKSRIVFPALLELHAWWHIFSCLGAYWFIVGMCFLMPQVQALKPQIVFVFYGLLPVVRIGHQKVKNE